MNGIQTMKRLCTSRKRKFNSNLLRSLNRQLNPPKTKSSSQLHFRTQQLENHVMTTDFLRYQRGTVYTIKRGLIQFKIINFSNSTILNNLVNEGKLYGIKLQRFEKVAVELISFTVVTIQSRHQLLERRANARNVTYCKHKDQKRNYRALPMWLMLPNGNELPLSQCFRYLDHVCFRLFPSPLQATRNKIAYFFCARMPVYRFALPLKTVSGHVIKNLLTEFSGVRGENIWLWVMKQGLALGPQIMTPSQIIQ